MLQTALQLARRGLHVFPCRPRNKLPATQHGCLDASSDPATIKQWWCHEPSYNIGIACGQRSRVFVIDIDSLSAEAELEKLEREHGELPATVEVITARGRHVYFRTPEATICNSVGKVAPGVDVRGDNGFVLAPPSIHPSGRAYCWSVDCARSFAEAPDWLLARVTERAIGCALAVPPSVWRSLMADGVPEGQRDNTLARISGYLLRHRIDPIFAAGLVRLFNAARCLPPLPDEDVERIVDSIAGKELRRRQGRDG